MRKVKYLFLFLLLISVCAGFAACSKEPEELSAPTNLSVSDDEILTWDKVEGASSYLVEIDDRYYETETNSLDIFELTAEYKTFQIKVTACGDLKSVFDSKPSETLEYVVEAYGTEQTLPNGMVILKSGIALSLMKSGMDYEVRNRDVNNTKGKIIIPSEYNGKPIISLYAEVFASSFFYGHCPITGVILPDSVETIGSGAFDGCIDLKRVRLPAGIKTLESGTFSGCINLTQITLPDSLETLKYGAFLNCTSLTSITLPTTLKTLEDAVINCPALTEIELPSTLETIKEVGVLRGCSGLERINMEENDYYKVDGNCLIHKADNTVIAGCKTSVIPEYARAIGESAFRGLKSLTEIVIPDSVKQINRLAFSNSGLKEVTLPPALKVIEANAFGSCSNLEKVTMPASLESVDSTVFNGCKKLAELTAKEGAIYKSEGNCLIRKSDNTLVLGCTASVIPACVEKIGYSAFCGSGIERLEIPASVKTIDSYAFAVCSELKEIQFSEGLEVINGFAFSNCTALTELHFPNGLKTIWHSAFQDCENLTEITLPVSLESLSDSAFKNCGLKKIDMEEGETYRLEVNKSGSSKIVEYLVVNKADNKKVLWAYGIENVPDTTEA